MGILDEDVVRVRESTDMVALVGEHLALKRVGARYRGLCPFHQEKTPSFYVNPDLGLYKCFGCNAGGDAITFIRELEHLDFVEAVERLAGKAGIELRYDDQRATRDRSRNARLSEVVGKAVDVYHRWLLESPDAGPARKYLRGRGFDGEAVRRFSLGWSPDAWDDLSRTLQKDGVSRDDIVDAGLAFVNRANRLQDQFRGRLMFPIFDARGGPAGFGGRAIGDQQPKYKNSAENPLYHKSRILYGLHWAKADIVARGEVIVCEGYTDVMAFALSGMPNAVATCGTALTDDHVRALKNLARRVVLAYDADAAGQGAAERWYAWESEYEIELRVAALPPGRDPADVWHDDPAVLRAAVEDATPFLRFRLDRLFAAADLTTPEGRGRAGQAAAALVAEHPNGLVRDQYVMELAGRLAIDADALRSSVANAPRRPAPRPDGAARRRPPPSPASSASPSASGPDGPPDVDDGPPPRGATADDSGPVGRSGRGVDRRELDLLKWVVHEPEMVADWIDVTFFTDPDTRTVFELLVGSHTFHEALDAAGGAPRELLERLAVEEPLADDDRSALAARLVVNAVEPRAADLLRSYLAAGDERASDVKRDLDDLVHLRELGEWHRAREAALRLVARVAGAGDVVAPVPGAPAGGAPGSDAATVPDGSDDEPPLGEAPDDEEPDWGPPDDGTF